MPYPVPRWALKAGGFLSEAIVTMSGFDGIGQSGRYSEQARIATEHSDAMTVHGI
jgi:hypothetical protein